MATAGEALPSLSNGITVLSERDASSAPPAESAQILDPIANSNTAKKTSMLDPANFPQQLSSADVYIELRYTPLDTTAALRFTRSPSCGANVLFLGTTRNNFDNRPVTCLSYSAYPALALKSLFAIAEEVRVKYGLEKVYIAHRLGKVDVEDESIAVSVSSGHRMAGWRGAEEVLERVKKRAEIWKREWFADTGTGDWRANRDRDGEGRVVERVSGKRQAMKSERGSVEVAKEVRQETRLGVEAGAAELSSTVGTGLEPDALSAAAETESRPAGLSSTQEERSDSQPTAQTSGDDHDQWSASAPSRAMTTHQTSKELDSDVADYIAAMTAKLKM